MIEREVLVTTRYGQMPAFMAAPSAAGQFPPVILYMDAPGIREELRNMARRIAARGFVCLLPDLYYRLGLLRFDIPRRNDAMSVVIRGAMTSLTNEAVAQDTGGMIAFLDAQEMVKQGPVGCVGHCMSGSFVAVVAVRYAARIKAAAALYGIGIVTEGEDSPHLQFDRVQGELYLAFAEVDPAVPDNVVPTLVDTFKRLGGRHTAKIVPHTHHGYQFSARPDFDAGAAEQTWDELFDLWERNLR